MAAEASIVKQYEDADFSKRVDIMLDNFASFTTQIEISFDAIKYRIKEDRAFADAYYSSCFEGGVEFSDVVKESFYNDNAMMHRMEANLFC